MSSARSSGEIPGVVTFEPGSQEYERATAPQNSRFTQRPSVVARPTSGEQVSACVVFAREQGLTVVPQATGHGAAEDLGGQTLLLDTTALDSVDIDVDGRRARAGAGCTWATVQAAAEPHGLLGLAGSAPDVGIAGYTFGAGVGWLVRPHGLASGSLRSVEYVDGSGTVRHAQDDAADALDQDAIWAFRGGGGVGIAVTLEFDLVPKGDLWGGYLLWPSQSLRDVVDAWRTALPRAGSSLTTSLALLAAPPGSPIPKQLQGTTVVLLSMASNAGPGDAAALFEALGQVTDPVQNTWGPCDAARLSTIHLDPPVAGPALGYARWLDDSLLSIAPELYSTAADTGVVQFEVRNVANEAAARPGALDRAPGTFMVHAVAAAPAGEDTTALEADLDRIGAAAESADTGLAIGSWSDGRADVPNALPSPVRDRISDIADRVDPDRVIARSPLVSVRSSESLASSRDE